MQDVYGIDISDPAVLDGRSWRWLSVRIGGLLEHPCRSRLSVALWGEKPLPVILYSTKGR